MASREGAIRVALAMLRVTDKSGELSYGAIAFHVLVWLAVFVGSSAFVPYPFGVIAPAIFVPACVGYWKSNQYGLKEGDGFSEAWKGSFEQKFVPVQRGRRRNPKAFQELASPAAGVLASTSDSLDLSDLNNGASIFEVENIWSDPDLFHEQMLKDDSYRVHEELLSGIRDGCGGFDCMSGFDSFSANSDDIGTDFSGGMGAGEIIQTGLFGD